MTETVQQHIVAIIEQIREPLELDRWCIMPHIGALEDCRAGSDPAPEYREAPVYFDLDKLKTGDDLQELVVHEAGAHLHTAELHDIALELADALADSMPESHREGVRKLLKRRVNFAAERVTTDVGQTYLRLLRRSKVLDTPGPTA